MLQPIKVTIDDAHLLWGLSKWITYHKPKCVPVLKQSLIDCNLWIIDNLDLKECLGLLAAYANITSYERLKANGFINL